MYAAQAMYSPASVSVKPLSVRLWHLLVAFCGDSHGDVSFRRTGSRSTRVGSLTTAVWTAIVLRTLVTYITDTVKLGFI